MNDTIKKLPVTKDRNGNNLRGFVKLADIPDNDTTLIMQRYLLTKIETSITREEALVLSQAILEHFDAPAPTTIPHGHGPIGGFHALLDEARAQDHTNIALSRGHANLIAEHIRLLEEQLGAYQSMATIYQVEATVEKDAAGNVTRLEWADVTEETAKTAWNEYGLLVRTVLQKSPVELTENVTQPAIDCPGCRVTDEERALLANGDYRPEELWGVGGVKTCPKCAGKKHEKE